MASVAPKRWFDAVEPVTVEIECGDDGRHRVSWRRGKVVLHDHSLRDEEVMLALGGAPPPCVALLLSWRDSPAWERACRPQPPGFVRRLPPPALPGDLDGVRKLGVVRSWERRWARGGHPDTAEDLYRVLRQRALRPLTTYLDATRRQKGGGAITFAEIRLAEHADQPRVDGRIEPAKSSLVVALHPSWMYEPAPGMLGEFPLGNGAVVGWREISAGVWRAEVVQPS